MSSPSVPFGTRTSRRPPWSRLPATSIVERSWPTIARTGRRSRKARSLFSTGPVACGRTASPSSSYHSQNGSSPTGSSNSSSSCSRQRIVAEQPGHVGERRPPARREQGEQGGAQDVVGARPPEALVDAAEDPDQLVDDQVVVGAFEHVQAGRGGIERIEQIDPVFEPGRDPLEDLLDQIALGVDHDRAAARLEVGEREPGDQRRLADPGRAEQVQVVAGVGDRERDRLAARGEPERLPARGEAGGRGDAAGAGAHEPGQRASRPAGARARPAPGSRAGSRAGRARAGAASGSPRACGGGAGRPGPRSRRRRRRERGSCRARSLVPGS